MTTGKETFFKSPRGNAEQKAKETDATARSIIAREAASRDKKTEKLRILRLAKEAAMLLPVPKNKRK